MMQDVLPDPDQSDSEEIDEVEEDGKDTESDIESDEDEDYEDLDESPALQDDSTKITLKDLAIFVSLIENTRNQKHQEDMLRQMTYQEQIEYFDQKMQPREEYVNQERLQYEINKVLGKRTSVEKKEVDSPFVINNLNDREAYINWIREEYAFEEDKNFELV